MLGMFTKARDARGRVLPATVQDIEAVKVKLEAARARLREAEADRDARALNAVLAGDTWPAHDAVQAVRDAQDSIGVYEAALAAAHRAEEQRKAAARSALDKSRRRAIRQHGSQLERHMRQAEAAVVNLVSAYRSAVAEGETIIRLLGPAEAQMAVKFGAKPLRGLIERELSRVGEPSPLSGEPYAPGVRQSVNWQHPDGQLPLGDRFKAEFDSWFDWLEAGGSAAAPVEPAQEDAPPAVDAEPVEPLDMGPEPARPVVEPLAFTEAPPPEPVVPPAYTAEFIETEAQAIRQAVAEGLLPAAPAQEAAQEQAP